MTVADFVPGQMYNRRRDIHARFGGQGQGGISTPAKFPLVIAFTGASGAKHGYADEWTADGTFRYFGEGQEGDMSLTVGNRAIAEHADKGEDLLLFETLGRGRVRYRGPFNCAGYSFEPGRDRLGHARQAIVFQLVPIEGGEALAGSAPAATSAVDLAELRRRAMEAAGPTRQTSGSEAARIYYARSQAVRAYVLARAQGICESCGAAAPFVTSRGTPYLEPHHIRRLTDAGLDDPTFMGAICPNCHREIHHGRNGKRRNEELQVRIKAKEQLG